MRLVHNSCVSGCHPNKDRSVHLSGRMAQKETPTELVANPDVDCSLKKEIRDNFSTTL